MKSKKACSFILAAALISSVSLSAAATENEQKITVSMNVSDSSSLLLQQTEYQLSDWVWGEEDYQRNSYHTIIKQEPRTVDMGNVYSAPRGTTITVSYHGDYNTKCWLKAWSDPDHDGIYDLRIYDPDCALLPITEVGPLHGDAEHYYRSGGHPIMDNRIDPEGIGASEVEDVSFSAGWLIDQYGPDTLISIEVSDTYDEAKGWTTQDYYFMLSDEYVDPNILDIQNVSFSKSGSTVKPWAVDMINDAEKSGAIPELLYGFDLTAPMSRSKFTATVMSLYEKAGGDTFTEYSSCPFDDINEYVGEGMIIHNAFKLGLVNGTSATTFSPNDSLTREQAATMMARLYEKLGGTVPQTTRTSFADDAAVSSWAKSAVAFMADQGVVNGVGDNRFAPKDTLTREDALIMANRLLGKL